MTSHYTKVAFLSTNPVSDLVNPDCFNVYVSWNENLEKDRAITRRGRITFFQNSRDGGLFAERHLPFSHCWRNFFMILVKQCTIKRMTSSCLWFLRSMKTIVKMLKFRQMPSSRELFHECRIHLFANTSRDVQDRALVTLNSNDPPKIGLPTNGTENLISDRKIRIYLG